MSSATTYNISESNFGKNSFRRVTPSNDLRERSIVCSSSQCGSNGWISVITCTSRSCAKPKEHSVKKVVFAFQPFSVGRLFCDIEKTRRVDPLQSKTAIWLLGGLAAKGRSSSVAGRPELVDFVGEMSSKPCSILTPGNKRAEKE
jgi:hypothetical protein